MQDDSEAWLKVVQLSKHFGGARALSAVDLDIHRGEVHGLVGANGAGKSTLIRSLAGITAPDEGSILIDGEEVKISTPKDAENAGFAFIHQELNLVPHFSAVQNILLGAPKVTRAGFIDWKRSRRAAVAAAERVGARFSLDRRVDELSVAERWLVMISKALVRNASMIAMDEPSASLSDVEAHQLFAVVRDLAASGVAILYVSHRLDEVLDLSDRITVFRDGRVTDRAVRGQLDKRGLIKAIVGRDIVAPERTRRSSLRLSDRPIFEAVSVCRGRAVRGVSFQAYPGEILGLGGLVGAGRTEVARLAFGADKIESGGFLIDDKPLVASSVARAVQQGMALVPEERRSQGLILEKSVSYNMNIAVLRSLRTIRGLPFVSSTKSKARALEMVKLLSVKTGSINEPIAGLSGGNQQKALIARWLTPSVKVLFFDEPSRGVDIGARQEIHQAIRDLADRGVGTIVISSDVEELAILCDRIVVMREGEVSGELSGDDVTEANIIELSYAPVEELQGDPA